MDSLGPNIPPEPEPAGKHQQRPTQARDRDETLTRTQRLQHATTTGQAGEGLQLQGPMQNPPKVAEPHGTFLTDRQTRKGG